MRYRERSASPVDIGSSSEFGIDIRLTRADDAARTGADRLMRVHLSGALDRAYTTVLRTVLRQLRDSGSRYIALDLSALDRLSISSAAVMMSAIKEYATAGGSLRMVRPSPAARRVLALFPAWGAPAVAAPDVGVPAAGAHSPHRVSRRTRAARSAARTVRGAHRPASHP